MPSRSNALNQSSRWSKVKTTSSPRGVRQARILCERFHQPIGKIYVFFERDHPNSLISSMRAAVIQIVKHSVDPVARHAARARVATVAGSGRHFWENNDTGPDAVRAFLYCAHERRG